MNGKVITVYVNGQPRSAVLKFPRTTYTDGSQKWRLSILAGGGTTDMTFTKDQMADWVNAPDKKR